MEKQMKPCCYCGWNGSRVYEATRSYRLMVICGRCDKEGPQGVTEREAISLWNGEWTKELLDQQQTRKALTITLTSREVIDLAKLIDARLTTMRREPYPPLMQETRREEIRREGRRLIELLIRFGETENAPDARRPARNYIKNTH